MFDLTTWDKLFADNHAHPLIYRWNASSSACLTEEQGLPDTTRTFSPHCRTPWRPQRCGSVTAPSGNGSCGSEKTVSVFRARRWWSFIIPNSYMKQNLGESIPSSGVWPSSQLGTLTREYALRKNNLWIWTQKCHMSIVCMLTHRMT